MIRLYIGGLTGVHDTEHESLEVSVNVITEVEGTSIAQMLSGFDLGPSPIRLTDEIVI